MLADNFEAAATLRETEIVAYLHQVIHIYAGFRHTYQQSIITYPRKRQTSCQKR